MIIKLLGTIDVDIDKLTKEDYTPYFHLGTLVERTPMFIKDDKDRVHVIYGVKQVSKNKYLIVGHIL